MSLMETGVMPGDAVLDCAAQDVDPEEIADLVNIQADPCATPCDSIAFLKHHVLPVLGLALRATLVEIRRERCVERAYSRLNALDFLAGQLYWHNPRYPERSLIPGGGDIMDTEVAEKYMESHPRRALPLCLRLSDHQAAVIVQKWYRGYLVRRQPDVSRLRQYQTQLRRLARQPDAPTGPAPVPERTGRPCR